VTIGGVMNCTEDFVQGMQDGAAAFGAAVQAYCADPSHTCSAQVQAALASAQLTMTGASAAPSSDPTATSDTALCRRDVTFQCAFADPANVMPASSSGNPTSGTKRATDEFATTLQAFSDACVSMSGCAVDSSSAPPADAPAQTLVDASVPPIAGWSVARS
jgi:hypothetical protein